MHIVINQMLLHSSPPGYSPSEELRSLTVVSTDGTFDSDPIHVNVTVVNVNERVDIRHDTIGIECKSTGVTEKLSELLQVC